MKWIQKTYLRCIPLCFVVCYSLHKRKWRLVTSIWQRVAGSWTSRNKNGVFSPKFKSAANFSAPAQEGNLLFLSGRLSRKKLHNFLIKSSHLCRTSRQVWLSSSTCDHCCAYQLICIEIGNLAARAHFFIASHAGDFRGARISSLPTNTSSPKIACVGG